MAFEIPEITRVGAARFKIDLGKTAVFINVEEGDDRSRITRLTFDGDISPATLRQFPLSRVETLINNISRGAPSQGAKRPRLRRPTGTDPASFYQAVADAYNEFLATTHAPAVAIAEEANVPIGTAHRWICEARRRGSLVGA